MISNKPAVAASPARDPSRMLTQRRYSRGERYRAGICFEGRADLAE